MRVDKWCILQLSEMQRSFTMTDEKYIETCCKQTCCADGCCSDGCNTGDCSSSCCADGCCSEKDNCC